MFTKNYQNTKGRFAGVLVALTYTAQTTYADYINNSIEGEIAVINKADNSIFDGTSAIPAGTEVFIVEKRNGDFKIEPSFVVGGTNYEKRSSITKQIGVAGTAQVTQVVISCGGNGTADCGNCINCVADPLEDYSIGIVDKQTHDFVPDEQRFTTVALTNETVQALVTRIVGRINDLTYPENARGQRVTASAPVVVAGSGSTPTTITFNLTGTTFAPFTVTSTGFCVITKTITTAGLDAVNGVTDISYFEYEGIVADGKTSPLMVFPPMTDLTPNPTRFASTVSTALFTVFEIKRDSNQIARTYNERDFNRYDTMVVGLNSSTVVTKLATLLGV